jgi:hypothetical protein
MSREIAAALAEAKLEEWRTRSYAELRALVGETVAEAVTGPDGNEYQIEVDIFWDSPKQRRDIHVLVSIDGGGVSSFLPLLRDFIVSP